MHIGEPWQDVAMEPVVVRNDAESRFEIREDGQLMGVAIYSDRGGVLSIDHVIVEPAFEGRGVGSALMRGLLASLPESQRIYPSCPFAAAFLTKHEEYQHFVSE
jgi:predicted GNAT family acetyltransferase